MKMLLPAGKSLVRRLLLPAVAGACTLVLGTGCDGGRADDGPAWKAPQDSSMPEAFAPDELVQKALESGAYSHVYVGGLMQEDEKLAIDARYACLTGGRENLRAQTLYRVERGADGGAVLVDMGTMNGQEP